MNPTRTHDRQSFFKHTTAGTALSILSGSKLRWSMPSLFNDPFDVPVNIFDGIDKERLRDALVNRMNALVETPILPYPEHHSMMTRLLLSLFSRADAATKRELMEANEESRRDPIVIGEGLNLLKERWRSMYWEQRILCLTERWDSASMWDRYSDGHRGAVLEFACLDDLDSAWLIAKPVRYQDEPLRVNTNEGLAELMFYEPDFAVLKMMEEYTHTKTTDWAYEKEWRIASWKRPHENGDYSDYGFAPEELQGITFGFAIGSDAKNALTQAIKGHYPNAGLWQASIEGARFMSRKEI